MTSIRNCIAWNMVDMGKLVWQVAQKDDVLRIKWIHSYNSNSWRNDSKKYTAKEGYQWLKGQYEVVGWHHWAWNRFNVPKDAFMSWLIALGKVRTTERLKAAGVCNDVSCLLCDSGTDSCMHLFFRCHFSRIMCTNIMIRVQIRVRNDEYLYTTWKKRGRRHRSRKEQQICCTALASTVYHIWIARNHSLWENAVIHPDTVVKCIKQEVVGRAIIKMKDSWPDDVKNWVTDLAG
ncbi:uncharacterized protein LOC125498818 [Beta vulgaris subsp. vulgaris]|uniref:uncharacterized protein LOC125498818 n=1 Tax=Beta vulgaris subsp. vulgaris TaxID=3555 RepID=UPI0020374094|nr:uncharacterized protein LOC125498818 [Beta vulgaris subsp. vulgaris]